MNTLGHDPLPQQRGLTASGLADPSGTLLPAPPGVVGPFLCFPEPLSVPSGLSDLSPWPAASHQSFEGDLDKQGLIKPTYPAGSSAPKP